MKREEEATLFKMFMDIREDMESSFENRACKVGISVVDLIGESFEYVWNGIEKGAVGFPKTRRNFKKLINSKANYLF